MQLRMCATAGRERHWMTLRALRVCTPRVLSRYVPEFLPPCGAAAGARLMVFYGGGQTSSSASKKIAAILRAANHFDRLQLPKPYADLAGEPVWDVSEEQVAKSFRKLSLCCHPDKSSDPEAPAAFELLKKAKACLLNELQQGRSAPSAEPQLGSCASPAPVLPQGAPSGLRGRSGTRRPRDRATGHPAMTSDGRT